MIYVTVIYHQLPHFSVRDVVCGDTPNHESHVFGYSSAGLIEDVGAVNFLVDVLDIPSAEIEVVSACFIVRRNVRNEDVVGGVNVFTAVVV